jgi:serine-type D-Ala-D-Ala carboxypeptidase (penicillin-binding protein 5/6)
LQDKTFARVAATVEHVLPNTTDHKYIYLYNQTNLLTSYPGVKGVKTGFTPGAGLCLITYVENGGHKIIGVILNSESRREEMRELLDYSFTVLGVSVPGRTR